MNELSIESIKGVGLRTADKLRHMGIHSYVDLLRHLPRRYEDRTEIVNVKNLIPGKPSCIFGHLTKLNLRRYKNGGFVEGEIDDGTQSIKCLWFHSPYLMKSLLVGERLCLFGPSDIKNHQLVMIHPEIEKSFEENGKRIHMGRIVPFYPLSGEVSQRMLRNVMYEGLVQYLPKIEDSLPTLIREKQELQHIKFALKEIHFPKNFENAKLAHNRMVFDEFIAIRLALQLKKMKRKKDSGISKQIIGDLQEYLGAFQDLLPFQLDAGQTKVMTQIFNDFKKGQMHRLLQGDVGSGKTVVACFALYLCQIAGYQSTLIAPTDILATQHHMTLSKYFAQIGIEVVLLASSVSTQQKMTTLKRIESGEVAIVVGTHAILNDDVRFKRLGLSIFDEQHKFGVQQRERLEKKFKHNFHLLISATPIPRTLAMSLYDDIDISEMKSKTRKMSKRKTLWISEGERGMAYELAKIEIDAGRQVYLVFPAISKTESNILSIDDAKDILGKFLPNVSFAQIHGKMKKNDVNAAMDRFRNKEIPLLVATTVIEVGVDIPNASLMIVEGADRFGLSQLHQLRGRVGRGSSASYCVMIADTNNPDSADRLEAFASTDDGFELAQKDLKLRGAGNLIGLNQHGSFGTRIADPFAHAALFEKSAICAQEILTQHNFATSSEFAALRKKVSRVVKSRGVE